MNILVTAAHPDDEVLGVGGTIAKRVEEGHAVFVCIVADGITARGDQREQQLECARKACAELGVRKVFLPGLKDQQLDVYPLVDLNKKLEEIIREAAPQVVYTHFYGDLNMDHRVVFEATMVAARPHASGVRKILCFETLSSTEWNAPQRDVFAPNVFEDVTQTFAQKNRALAYYTKTSLGEIKEFPHPRSFECVEALAKLRGATVGVERAEAFMLMREINS
ncbi:MAG: PIG-L deacetylase family protein [Limisphaerales bacterium]